MSLFYASIRLLGEADSCLLTQRQIIMHDIANAECHIDDEIGAGAHI
jgi:hypothetical protein